MNNFQLNVGKLKTLIRDLPDSTHVVVPASDHSFRVADGIPGTAIVYHGHFSEDFGDEHNEPGGERIPVLIIQ